MRNTLRKQRNKHKVSLIGSSDDPRRVQRWIKEGLFVIPDGAIKPEDLAHNQPGRIVVYEEPKKKRGFSWLS